MLLRKGKKLLLLFLIFHSVLFGQEYLTEINSYSVEDGLSSRFIFDIHQDTQGFLWIATKNGLNRFDGSNFTVFNSKNSDLPHDEYLEIFEDVNGILWPTSKDHKEGSSSFWKSVILPSLEIKPLDEYLGVEAPFKSNEITLISQLDDKIILISTKSGGIYTYDGTFKKIAQDERLIYMNLLGKEDERYFFTDLQHVIEVSENEKTKTYQRHKRGNFPIRYNGDIYWMHLIPNSVPVKVDGTIFSDTDTIQYPFFTSEEFEKFVKSNILHTQRKNLTYARSLFHPEKAKAFFEEKNDLISYLYQEVIEKNPEIYIGNYHELSGNKFVIKSLDRFIFISYAKNQFKKLLENGNVSCRSFYKNSKGELILATYNGIKKIDLKSWEIEHLLDNPNGMRGMTELSNGDMVFGSYGNTAKRVNLDKKKAIYATRKKDKKQRGPKAYHFLPFKDSKGNIWMSSTLGIAQYDPDKNMLLPFEKYNEFEKLKNIESHFFIEDNDGVWICTTNGLYLLHPEKGIIAEHHPLPNLNVMHFYREGDIFWIATYGKGLIKWNKSTGETLSFGLKHGLLDEYLMAVYPDKIGNLWVTTNKGLGRFDRKKERFRIYLDSDGIAHNEFNISSHYQHDDGQLFFGGVKGVTYFHPKQLVASEEKGFKLIITGYEEIDNATLTSKDKTTTFYNSKKIEVASSVQSFILKFALLNYENIKDTRYAYKVDELDNDWIFQEENQLRFNRFPYGKYNLRLKAIDYRGNESEEMIVPMTINAPFYKKTGWQLLGLFFLFGLGGFLIWRRTIFIRNRNEELEKIVTKRTQELQTLNSTKDRLFAILAHDLRNPVVAFEELSETINYLLGKGDHEQVMKLGNHIEIEAKQLHHLMDNLLNWALSQRDELPINMSEFSVSEFISNISKVYQHLEKRTGVKIITEATPNLKVVSDKRILEIVSRNIITNAFKYTQAEGWIKINGYQKGDYTFLEFKDNGQGMTKRELENLFNVTEKFKSKGNIATVSLGMHLCKELIELLGGDIFAEAEPNKGTYVTIKIPVGT